MGHSKPDCKVIDLYNVPDPQRYLNPLEDRVEDADVSEPLVDYYRNGPQGSHNMFNLNNNEDDDLVEDSDDEEDEINSVW